MPEETEFVTQTKKEIGGIAWHKLKDLSVICQSGKVDLAQVMMPTSHAPRPLGGERQGPGHGRQYL